MRSDVLGDVADLVPERPDGFVLVGIDGADGSGKTTFADDLAGLLAARGRPVVRVLVDDFHHPRTHRYRLGRESPEGFYHDSFDIGRLLDDVLVPMAPGGSGRISRRAHELATDATLSPVWEDAATGSAAVVDGLFLHRAELAGVWDLSVWLAVPFDVTCARGPPGRQQPRPGPPEHGEIRRGAEEIRRRAIPGRPG